MPPKMHQRLNKIAANLDRSRNWLINQAIEQYLDRILAAIHTSRKWPDEFTNLE